MLYKGLCGDSKGDILLNLQELSGKCQEPYFTSFLDRQILYLKYDELIVDFNSAPALYEEISFHFLKRIEEDDPFTNLASFVKPSKSSLNLVKMFGQIIAVLPLSMFEEVLSHILCNFPTLTVPAR